jgi:hypothetical protein
MGFFEGPHQCSHRNFVEIRFSKDLHWGSYGDFVEIGFSDGIKEISSKWGSWQFCRNEVFRRPPSRLSWKFRQNKFFRRPALRILWKFHGDRVFRWHQGNFVEMVFVEISSKWGFSNASIEDLVEISSK